MMMKINPDVWTDKHQMKSQKEEGGHDASRDTTVEASPYSCDVCGVNVNTCKQGVSDKFASHAL